MNDIYYIIGCSYAGKSTMVRSLAEKFDAIECGENYQDFMLEGLDKDEFPNLCYTRDLQDWKQFIRRTPEEYAAWIECAKKECEILELRILEDLKKQGRRIFVDTNISVETLKKISDKDHVLIMLTDRETSINRFFERPDKEKQFIYRLLMEEPDPEAALARYRRTLELIHSKESYDRLLDSGFNILYRDESRTVEKTRDFIAEKYFKLQ